MMRALHSAIGLPSRLTSALWMLGFLMPLDVSRNFMMPLLADLMGAERLLQFLLLRCGYTTCRPTARVSGLVGEPANETKKSVRLDSSIFARPTTKSAALSR